MSENDGALAVGDDEVEALLRLIYCEHDGHPSQGSAARCKQRRVETAERILASRTPSPTVGDWVILRDVQDVPGMAYRHKHADGRHCILSKDVGWYFHTHDSNSGQGTCLREHYDPFAARAAAETRGEGEG